RMIEHFLERLLQLLSVGGGQAIGHGPQRTQQHREGKGPPEAAWRAIVDQTVHLLDASGGGPGSCDGSAGPTRRVPPTAPCAQGDRSGVRFDPEKREKVAAIMAPAWNRIQVADRCHRPSR